MGIVLAQHWSRPMVQQLEHLNKEQSHVLVPEKMGLPWLLQKMFGRPLMGLSRWGILLNLQFYSTIMIYHSKAIL